jgi:hypothetical protein
MTTMASMTGAVFPYVTHPYYEIAGGYTDGMGMLMNAAFAPIVKAEERIAWEEYAVKNQGWLEESARLKEAHPGHTHPLRGTNQDHESRRLEEKVDIPPIRKRIWMWEDGKQVQENDGSPGDTFAPLWQISPANATAVNVNLFSDKRITDMYTPMIETRQPLLRQTNHRHVRSHD